ncbi:MAG TPA: UPF0280 family protein [Thermosulfurimonas dismutans]|uniref:UPF0280 family protein n=1 Tax=Thermosulfurimonas dismutans TaxID=999894 RepID=A0A7C3CKJ5_9BACT|nr:UPF0280 family protein [Thermosulfurimonas dismutans]
MPVAWGEIRHYRTWLRPGQELQAFRVVYRETDLAILAERDLSMEVLHLIQEIRRPLERYIQDHPEFLKALKPLSEDPGAPPLVRKMMTAARLARVGPMAAVAGAIAEEVGHQLLARGLTSQVVVENGGDIFLALERSATVALYAGESPLSGRVGLRIAREFMPCGVCTSSGRVGHSLSLGRAEAVCVIARDTALADAAATALANLVKGRKSLPRVLEAAEDIPGILGVVAVVEDRLGARGKAVELVSL